MYKYFSLSIAAFVCFSAVVRKRNKKRKGFYTTQLKKPLIQKGFALYCRKLFFKLGNNTFCQFNHLFDTFFRQVPIFKFGKNIGQFVFHFV